MTQKNLFVLTRISLTIMPYLWLPASAPGCSAHDVNSSDTDSDTDTDTDSDTDTDTDSDTDTDTDSDTDTDTDSDTDTDTDSDTDTDTDTDTDSDTDTDTDADSDSDTDAVDCGNLPPLPITNITPIALPGLEDFTFNRDGYLVGITVGTQADGANNLVQVSYSGEVQILFPNITNSTTGSWVRGIRYLPGNEYLLFANGEDSSLYKVNLSNFSKQVLASGFNQPNGLSVDSLGYAYVTGGSNDIIRINPNTGATTVLTSVEYSTDGIALSPDFKTLFFNTEMRKVWQLPIDENGAAGDTSLLIDLYDPEGGPGIIMFDGMTVDACGNLYVVEMFGNILRVAPDGSHETVIELPAQYTYNAANFGSGLGGWKSDALYIVSMYGIGYEIPVGVTGAPQPHLQ